MAYAAVISLKHTTKHLLNSPHISIISPSRETIECAYEEAIALQELLRKLDYRRSMGSSKRVNALDQKIREAVSKFEDLLETNVSIQMLSRSEEIDVHALPVSLDLHEVNREIDSFLYTVYMLKEEFIYELSDEKEENSDNDDDVRSEIDAYGGSKTKMVGLSDQFSKVKDRLIRGEDMVISLSGMAGIGKTMLAQRIYDDPEVSEHYGFRTWVSVGRNYELDEIEKEIRVQGNLDQNAAKLTNVLNGTKHLVVLDDVWDPHFIFKVLKALEDFHGRRWFLVTTRLQKVAKRSYFHLNLRFLNEEESWNLLREKVFSREFSCPPRLEKAGREIAMKCDGLPLTIITVARLLSKADSNQELWEKFTERESSVFTDAYDQISTVLLPSYYHLSQHLKACFLYLGVFRQNFKIPCSKLIKLWSAEGLLEPIKLGTLNEFAWKYLKALVSTNLVLVCEESSRVKTCRLHSVFWHLCKRVAAKYNFFHISNRLADNLVTDLNCQRRLCVQNNVIFHIKDIYNSMAYIPTVRSLLCFGSPHQYPVLIPLDLRLLRVLDALTIHFYEFPTEVLKLVQLRYLAITYNGNLPRYISKLWNLQFLIVHTNLSIRPFRVHSLLPMEIWDMKELKHIQVTGRDLPNPRGESLPNLLTLLDASPQRCYENVSEGLPNLKILGIRIELTPHSIDEPLRCFDHISRFQGLESVKCKVMNPKVFRSDFPSTPLAPISNLPTGIRRLSLNGLGYPWKDMKVIALLPKLEELKLRCYAFCGPKWETEDSEFSGLQYLLIEDTDLVQWKVGENSFPKLKCLSIKHCYRLQGIPKIARDSDSLRTIEIIDCNPLVTTCAKLQMQKYKVNVSIKSTWDE